MVTEILSCPDLPENTKSEAAGVIAQVTSPTLGHINHLATFIDNMDDLVHSLTGKPLLTIFLLL